MAALICGSFAFDTVMLFRDRFGQHILPDKVHMLNVSFLVPEMRREFGGCGGNVAYNLKLLQGEGYALGTVGEDFAPYANWMDQNALPRDYLQVIPDTYTAQAFITTDLDDNQITAFHPGAMAFSGRLGIPEDRSFQVGLIAPDSFEGMVRHGEEMAAAGLKFIFDPGQAMTQFDGPALLAMLDRASYLAVNDYECEMVLNRTGLSRDQLAERVEGLIVTLGAKGSVIYAKGQTIEIPPARPTTVVDPTGCGDAYRAGLLLGIMTDRDWQTTGRIASLAGASKIECHGPQNHTFTWEAFQDRFAENFGFRP
ncbi:MAG: carbohydrate kinase family protein [Candidatus Competibacterales bacterium]